MAAKKDREAEQPESTGAAMWNKMAAQVLKFSQNYDRVKRSNIKTAIGHRTTAKSADGKD
jgi:hypothetical protein